MNKFIIAALIGAVYSSLGHAQGVMRCERADGKVEYAASCGGGDKAREIQAPREPDRRDADAQRKKTERDEAAFQRRHSAREKLAAQERRDKARIARDNERARVLRERAELAKAREERLAKQDDFGRPRRVRATPVQPKTP